jgi:hypothetical protein
MDVEKIERWLGAAIMLGLACKVMEAVLGVFV